MPGDDAFAAVAVGMRRAPSRARLKAGSGKPRRTGFLPTRRRRTRAARAKAVATGDQGGAVFAQPEVGWESLRDTDLIVSYAKKYDRWMRGYSALKSLEF